MLRRPEFWKRRMLSNGVIQIVFQPFHMPKVKKKKRKHTPKTHHKAQEVILLSIVEIKIQIMGNTCTGRIQLPTHLAVSLTGKQ